MSLSRLPSVFPAARRFFASTILLSRTWESETLVELRKEAKARGLSGKGNKSTLIARIQEHEENGVTSALPPIHTPGTSRGVATHILPPSLQEKTVQATSPGIPLTARSDGSPRKSEFVAIRLPDLSQSPPSPPVQVPYVPDFWNSAQSKVVLPAEPELPKLHVVSGSATHYDGGPMYTLQEHQERDSVFAQADDPLANRETGFWASFCESLGFPISFSPRRTLSSLATPAEEDEFQTQSRPLTGEERKGLYILLGIVGGSWLIGELMSRPAEHDT